MRYNGGVNPFLSRKTYVDICEWWPRTTAENQIALYRMAMTSAPAGKFRAKAVSQYTFNKKNEASIRLSGNYVTIETPDDISFARPDDCVKFQGIFYRIQSIAKREIAKTRENMRHPLCVYVMELVR